MSQVIKPLFTISWMLRWFSNKIIAYNLSFSTPLLCKHGGDGNVHLALMYNFNMRIRVSNLSLMLMRYNVSCHGCWVLSGKCQLLDGQRLVKQQSAFKLIRAPDFFHFFWLDISLFLLDSYGQFEQSKIQNCTSFIYPLTPGYIQYSIKPVASQEGL